MIEIKNRDGKVLLTVDADTLEGADLRDAILREADLQGANLQDAILRRADMQDVNLRGADLQWADLRGVDLQGANLRWADFEGTDLRGADLQGADLRGTKLQGADLQGADLRGANLDLSCFPLWCGSFDMTVDVSFIHQLCYHLCKLQCDDKEATEIKDKLIKYANKAGIIERHDLRKIE